MTSTTGEFRPVTEREQEIIERLLTANFSGKKELLEQLPGLLGREIDLNGSLEFKVTSLIRAPIEGSRVVDGRWLDDEINLNGVSTNVLLHIRKGVLWMLEFYRDDGSPVLKLPEPEKLCWIFTP